MERCFDALGVTMGKVRDTMGEVRDSVGHLNGRIDHLNAKIITPAKPRERSISSIMKEADHQCIAVQPVHY